jgi:cytochrome b561
MEAKTPSVTGQHSPTAPTAYSSLQIGAHWVTALLVVAQWYTSGGVLRTHAVHPIYWKPDPYDVLLHKLHIYGGVAVFALVALRIVLRWRIGVPAAPPDLPRWSVALARPAHLAMYVVLIGLSLTGLVTTYVWFWMNLPHRLLVNLLYVVVSLHVVAALWHDLAHQAGLNARMMPERMRRVLWRQTA